jgi:hypothetical protein
MVLGMSIENFTLIHVLISLVGIASGLVWLAGALFKRWLSVWNDLFLVTTLLTSLTGFLFPRAGFTPAIGVGLISVADLVVALIALYAFALRGGWRIVYMITAIVALYLNVFVLIAQSFLKIPALHALAPTGTEPAFVAAQAANLAGFVILGIIAVRQARAVTRR